MDKNKDVKLVKCTNCGKAFYVETKSKGEVKFICPYCEKEVTVKINDETHNEPQQPENP